MLKIKKLTPVYTKILVTCDKYTEPEKIDNTDIIDPAKAKIMIKKYQRVLAVGNMVRLVVPGDIIAINPMKYAKFKQVAQKNSLREDVQQYKKEIVGFDFPTMEVDGEEVMLLEENDILYIINDYEDDGQLPEGVVE